MYQRLARLAWTTIISQDVELQYCMKEAKLDERSRRRTSTARRIQRSADITGTALRASSVIIVQKVGNNSFCRDTEEPGDFSQSWRVSTRLPKGGILRDNAVGTIHRYTDPHSEDS